MKEMKRMTADEAKNWIKKNWGKLVCDGRLGEALARYYKISGKEPFEAYDDVKEMQPKI